MREIWHSAWLMLRRKRLRTALTVGGIAIGAAMVTLISGIGTVGERAIRQELQSMGIDGLSVSASEGLTVACLSSIRQLSEVEQAMPLLLRYGAVRFDHGSSESAVCCGIDAGADQVISLKLQHGRLLTAGDILGENEVCVVDEALARAVYGRSGIVGKSLTVLLENAAPQRLTVVGVTAAGSSLLQSVTSMIPYMVYIPYTTLQTLTGTETFDQIAVRAVSAAGTDEAQQAIEQSLARSGEPIGRLTTENLAVQRERLDSMVQILSLALTAIGGVSLLVSGFGIMTVMLSSVHERMREIGIKKAIGATRGRILAEFLAGAVLLSLLGAAAGLAIGCAVFWLGCTALGAEPAISVRQLLPVAGLTVLLGAVFGAYPAYKAAGLRPVEALRAE